MSQPFWPETATDASFEKLTSMRGAISFTLIGGWAVYLWTRQHKSKDIDIVVDLDTLYRLKSTENLQKNDRLKKYEINYDLFDIDIYAEHYSSLTLPVSTIRKNAQNVDGFSVASPETLLILKQGAWHDRKNSIKGRKDAIDIAGILMHAPVDLKTYRRLLKENGSEPYARELATVLKTFDPSDLKYLDSNVHAFKKWRKTVLEALRAGSTPPTQHVKNT